MWRGVMQVPRRALELGVHLWGLCLYSLCWGPLFCLLGLVRALRVGAQGVLPGLGLGVLQGLAWVAQLVGSWLALQARLAGAALELLRLSRWPWLWDPAARWLVQAGVWTGTRLARVGGLATAAQLCVHALVLATSLCLHVALASISTKVHVHAPVHLSLPIRVQLPWRPGVPHAQPPTTPTKEPRPPPTRSPPARRRREAPVRRRPSSVVPSAATLIILVCVSFLVLMVVLGLVRIHSLHCRVSGAGGPPGASSDPKDPDLFWDDSALTIIVNPMESYQNRQAGGVAAGRPEEEEDSSDSEAADSPMGDERRIMESPPHRY